MSVLGNVLWLIFGGIFPGLGYMFGGLALCLTIVGIPFGVRIIILWLVTIPNTIIGAIITLKRERVYTGYDVLDGRLAIEIMLDEQLGGIMIWGPGGMMGVIGMAVVFFLWRRDERKLC